MLDLPQMRDSNVYIEAMTTGLKKAKDLIVPIGESLVMLIKTMSTHPPRKEIVALIKPFAGKLVKVFELQNKINHENNNRIGQPRFIRPVEHELQLHYSNSDLEASWIANGKLQDRQRYYICRLKRRRIQENQNQSVWRES